METADLGGGMFSGMSSGMLGLELPLHQNPSKPQNPNSLQQPQMVGYDSHHPQAQQTTKPTGCPYSSSKSKQQLTLSDEDEPGFNPEENSGGDLKRNGSNNKSSPWQRVKWTETMVRLLIMAVFYIGDEGGLESTDPKKKPGSLLQKKGKWKSVSRAMMEKGFSVSPQQCEDKFNDLNKRYKRVNDILGKGTACRVVENQGLLETMDLSPKMKEEVKKLLNSKHLFFQEMCAYHTSCGHGVAHSSTEQQQQQQPPPHQQQQRCPHGAADNRPPVGEKDILCRAEADSSKVVGRGGCVAEEYDDEGDDDSADAEDDYDDSDDEQEDHEHENNVGNLNHPQKRPRKSSYSSSPSVMRQLNGEVMGIIQDTGKSLWEKRQWVKGKLLQLKEQQVSYLGEAYELERQRLKWVKFSTKKERDMERARLENERRLLETERMALLLRHKELELFDPQQQNRSNKRNDNI